MLQTILDQHKISLNTYKKLIELNERLSHDLVAVFKESGKLIETGIVENISDLLKLEKKPASNEEAFIIMRKEIFGPLGSKNAYIQSLAASIKDKLAQKYNFPQALVVEPLYNDLCIKYVPASEYEQKFLFFTHMYMLAKAIYIWVKEEISYISDPPDDWFKPALQTLIVRGGDCDDLAILLSSLWRSIGFKTYLGFLKGHVFPGVILARLSPNPINEENVPMEVKEFYSEAEETYFRVEEVKVPGDVRFNYNISVGDIVRSFDPFDLAFMGADFKEKLLDLTKELERLPNELKERAERELKKSLDEIMSRFNKLISAQIFEIEPIELGRLLKE